MHYGKKSSMDFKAKGSSKTYKKSDMCGPPASTNGFTDPGYIHDVLLTDLSPSSQYFYSYGSSKVSGYLVKLNKRSSLQTSLYTGRGKCPGWWGLLPYMGDTGTCRGIGYGF